MSDEEVVQQSEQAEPVVNEELAKEIEQAADQVTTELKERVDAGQEAEEQKDSEQVDAEKTVTEDSEVDSTSDTAAGDVIPEAEADTQHTSDESDDESSSVSMEEQKDDEPSVPDLSDEIIARGFSAGMALNDILSFPDEASLDRVVSAIEHRRQVESKVVQSETADNVIPEDPFADLKLDPDKYEPEMVELMDRVKGVLENQHQQIQTFKQSQEKVTEAAQAANAQEIKRWFDERVEQLGDDFVDALGTGDYHSLNRGSPQFANREAIAEQVTTMMAGYRARGIEAPSRDELFDTAARLVLADKYQDLNEKRLAGSLADRSEQHIQRVSSPKAKSKLTPEEEAAKAVSERFGIGI